MNLKSTKHWNSKTSCTPFLFSQRPLPEPFYITTLHSLQSSQITVSSKSWRISVQFGKRLLRRKRIGQYWTGLNSAINRIADPELNRCRLQIGISRCQLLGISRRAGSKNYNITDKKRQFPHFFNVLIQLSHSILID